MGEWLDIPLGAAVLADRIARASDGDAHAVLPARETRRPAKNKGMLPNGNGRHDGDALSVGRRNPQGN